MMFTLKRLRDVSHRNAYKISEKTLFSIQPVLPLLSLSVQKTCKFLIFPLELIGNSLDIYQFTIRISASAGPPLLDAITDL